MATQTKDYYGLLGIKKTANADDIRKAFRKLARKYHPDVNPNNKQAEEKFKEISEANDVLTDPKKRKIYDQLGYYSDNIDPAAAEAYARGGGFGAGGFGGRPGAGRRGAHGQEVPIDFSNFDFGNFSGGQRGAGTGGSGGFRDVFSSMFSGGGMGHESSGPMPGTDIEYTVNVGFWQAIKGGTVRLNIQRPDGGTEPLEFRIKPGTRDGQRIRLAGRGNPGARGGNIGDLYLIIRVGQHPVFSRDVDDIHIAVPISVAEAALGAKIDVPTIDGRAQLRVPPGTQSGQKLRMREKGVPSATKDGVRGDQIVEVKVAVPQMRDERSKEILREFAKLNAEDPRAELWSKV